MKTYLYKAFFMFFFCVSSIVATAQNITTIAGTGTPGYSGDGGAATAANIYNSLYGGVAVDALGNKYISDYGNSLIRKVNSTGVISTFAGVYGYAGSTGDGGPATAAYIAGPIGVAVDGAGNVYITGYSTNVIRKVNSTGIISTIAGTGSAGYSGDGGPATAAHLDQAWGVAVDYMGNVYIADNNNHVVRKVNTSGIISTFAGNGTSGYSGDGGPATAATMRNPVGVAVDKNRNVFIADLNDGRIRKVDTFGIITTVAGNGIGGFAGDGGPATSAKLYNSSGVAVDTLGNFWIADSYNNRIRKVDALGIITTIAGSGSIGSGSGGYGGDGGVATSALLHYPYGVATDGHGAIFIADNYNERIRMVVGNDRPPVFSSGVSQPITLCGNTIDTITSFLTVNDSDVGQLETWSLASAPAHGSAAVSFSMTSTGSFITPGTMTYTPSTGYSGLDTFSVMVSDGTMSDTITFYVTVHPTPVSISGPLAVCAGYTVTLTDTSSGAVWSSSNMSVATIGSSSGIVTGVSGGTTVISYTTGFGCYATATVTVITTVPSLTGLSAVCEGLTTPLSASVSGGTWTSSAPSVASVGSSSGIVSGNTTGVATITYSVGGSCNATKAMTVNMSPSPVSGTTAVCIGGSVTLTDPTSGGLWSSTNTVLAIVGSSTGIVLGVAYGTDTIKYTISNGCYAFTPLTVNPTPVISPFTSVYVGGTTTLAVYSGSGTWSSGSTSIATVGSTSGVVTGVTTGIAVISVGVGGCTNTMTINVVPPSTVPQIISTIAGTGTAGYSGDGGLATAAMLNFPEDVKVDGAGNVFIADHYNHRIRRVDATGTITTIAGTGTASYSGDGGAATAATFNSPMGLFKDGSGNVYVGDMLNQRVRVINSSGVITTFAGTGTSGFSGDGGPATAAKFHDPCGVFGDAFGNIYIADEHNHRIRKVDAAGNISTIAGTGTAGFAGDGGAATAAQLNNPKYVYADAAGCIYIADNSNNRIRIVNPYGIIRTYAGSGTAGFSGDGGAATAAQINLPGGITFDQFGNCYIADYNNNRVRKISSSGVISTVTGTGISGFFGDGCGPTAAKVYNPSNVALGPDGSLYIADYNNERIRKIVNDRAPVFVMGHNQYASVCMNDYLSLNPLLAAIDTDLSGAETWGIVLAPSHGAAVVAYSTGSSGMVITPTGLYYLPASGYVGADSFKVRITDCAGLADTTVIHVTVNPLPASITGVATICVGVSITLSDATVGGTWSCGSSLVATVGSSSGIVTGVSAGVPTITYMLPTGCYATATVTVHTPPAPITGTTTTCVGGTTTLYDPGGGVWSSSSPGVATVGSLSGVIAGIAPGSSLITYSTGIGCNTSIPVIVFPDPLPMTGTLNVCMGATTALSDAVPGGYWTSGSTTIATVGSASGVVTGLNAGTAIITYAVAPGLICSSTATVTVNPNPLPISGSGVVCVGHETTLSDYGGGTWSSGSPSIAAIGSSTGVVFGVSAGTSVITYTLPTGCFRTTIVTVNPLPAPISGVSHLCELSTTTFTDAGGGFWISTAPSVLDIDPVTGIATAVTAGTSVVMYTLFTGCVATLPVTVDVAPGPISGTPHVCAGSTSYLTDVTPGGTWSSGSPAIATLGSSSGLLSGISAGSAVVTYSVGAGCIAISVVTVDPMPGIITGPSSVCGGLSITLADGTPGGTWSSISSHISVGSLSGVVTGVSAGVATVTYTIATGCFTTKSITVNPIPGAITGGSGLCFGSTLTLSDPTAGGIWVSGLTFVATVGSSSGIVSGVGIGTATILYTLPTGCFNSVVVTVNPSPSAIAGLSAVCEGSSVSLTDPTPGGTWSSGSSSAIVGTYTGMVTGITAGTATISYTVGTGCSATKVITVNPLPLPIGGPSAVCVGATITETDPAGGTWISGLPSIATIGVTSGVVTGIVTGTTPITYTLPTGCRISKTVTVSLSPGPVVGPGVVCSGTPITYADAVSGGLWTSGSAGISVGSLTGIVTGLSAGPATITYSLGAGCTVTRSITVNASPTPITGSPVMCAGTTSVLADATPGGLWTIGSSIAMIGSSSGVVTCITTGVADVYYTIPSSGCSATISVSVNPMPTPIAGLNSVCVGASVAETDVTPGGIWTSASPSIAVIGSLTGIVTGVSLGTVVITYATGATGSWPGCSVTKTMTVAPASAVTGATGMCIGTTTTLTPAISGGAWLSGAPLIASVGTTGVVTGISFGSATITYTLPSGCYTTVTVTVNSGPAPVSGVPHLCVGETTTLTDSVGGGIWSSGSMVVAGIGSTSGIVTSLSAGATVITYSLGTGCTTTFSVTVDPVPSAIFGVSGMCVGLSSLFTDPTSGGYWSSGTPGVAGVGPLSGIVTGVTAGVATISYILPSGCAVTKSLTVNAGPSSVGGSLHMCVGSTTTLTDTAGGGVWSSGAMGIAMIGSYSGVVTGLATGVAPITYSLGTGCYTTSLVTVDPVPVGIAGTSSVCVGSSSVLADASPGGTWSSAAPGIASIGFATGLVTGISAGVATISYALPAGCYAIRSFTVSPVPAPVSGVAEVCVGAVTSLTDIVPGGTWTSADPLMASVGSATGIVTGVAAGTVTITYTTGSGCYALRVVTVDPLPSPIAGLASVCVGANTTLTDATSGGIWTSGTPGVASVGATTGIVSGLVAGISVVSYTSVIGCSVSRIVTVNPIPAPVSGPATVCISSSVTLSDVTPGGTWSSANLLIATIGSGTGIVSGISIGTVAITYTSAAGCRIMRNITVNPLPPGIVGTPNVCAGSTITLTDPATGGTWSSADISLAIVGSLTGVVTGMSGGSVAISYTVPTGCSATYTVSVNEVPPITGVTAMCAWGDTVTVHDANPAGSYSSTLVTVLNLGLGLGRVTTNAPGTGTLTYTLTSGCHRTVVITVNPLPAAITGTMHGCTGAPIALHELATGGVWTSGTPTVATIGSLSGIVTGLSSGSAHITYTLPTGCNIDTVVVIDPSPGGITVMSSTVIIGSTDLFTDVTPGGIWSSGAPAIATVGSATGIVLGVSLGVADISYTLSSSVCPAVRQVTVVSLSSVHPGEEEVGVYPNPSKGEFTVKGILGHFSGPMSFVGHEGSINIEVTDMMGRTLVRRYVNVRDGYLNENIVLPVGAPNGMYLLSIRSDQDTKVFHIMIER